MAKQIIWSNKAQKDRKEILAYWLARNKSAAYSNKLNLLLILGAAAIADFPESGVQTDVMNIRMKLVKDYYLFYRIKESTIEIISIWDTRRNPDESPF